MTDTVTILVEGPFWLPKGGAEGKMLLRPGANTIPRKRWELALEHPAIQAYVKCGTLNPNPSKTQVADRSHAPDTASGLTEMTITKAKKWIDAADDNELLLKWRNDDKRVGIRTAIDARMAALEDDLEEGDALEDDELADDDDPEPELD